MSKGKNFDDAEYGEGVQRWLDSGGEGEVPSFTSKKTARCHETHPVLKLGGGVLVGGACADPRSGFDVYIGLDWNMHRSGERYPWENQGGPINVHFPIQDMSIPQDVGNFRSLVTWICNQLQAGKRVHIGCIGGHGRTGLLLSAIVAELKAAEDPIKWVRMNHCVKAVESIRQVDFLVKHYGVKPHDGYKDAKMSGGGSSKGGGKQYSMSLGTSSGTPAAQTSQKLQALKGTGATKSNTVFNPVGSKKSIWSR